MTHVRKQVRDGVKQRLSTLSSLGPRVHNASRQVRAFQSNDFPCALVATSENASLADKGPAGARTLQRDLVVAITLAVHEDHSDAEDALDELSVDVEKSLVMPSYVGVGKLMFWKYDGSSPISPQPTQDGMMLTQTMTYSCSVLTLDTAPDMNLHPA